MENLLLAILTMPSTEAKTLEIVDTQERLPN